MADVVFRLQGRRLVLILWQKYGAVAAV